MYVVVVQDELMVVKNVVQCDTLSKVAEVLDVLNPDMDSSSIISGQNSSLTYHSDGYSNTYSIMKLETSMDYIEDEYSVYNV